jgi:hypothetical protein
MGAEGARGARSHVLYLARTGRTDVSIGRRPGGLTGRVVTLARLLSSFATRRERTGLSLAPTEQTCQSGSERHLAHLVTLSIGMEARIQIASTRAWPGELKQFRRVRDRTLGSLTVRDYHSRL